jgi:hypothetical protein
MTGRVLRLVAATFVLGATLLAATAATEPAAADGRAAPAVATDTRVPVLAYYYIWFDTTSWNRAKRDYPLIGRYSSNDASVMRTHIREAKRAGINGFIVSWKHTPSLDRRLSTLIDVAESEHFELSIIYQGLDFYRRPLPVERVAGDLDYFARTFADREPFRMFAKPLVIWSGTWEFSAEDIAATTAPVRDRLLVLGSEKNVAGIERLGDAVDGDAYYWSSVNPDTYPGYEAKLVDMAQAVHDRGGIWIPPAAAGFDARAIGGTTTVGRDDGRTLVRECAAAHRSRPDAIGIISWNEFSENSHIEPSVNHGSRYLAAASKCAATNGSPAIPAAGVGSSDTTDSSSPGKGPATGLIVAPLAIAVMGIALFVVLRRGNPGGDAGDDDRDPDGGHGPEAPGTTAPTDTVDITDLTEASEVTPAPTSRRARREQRDRRAASPAVGLET